MNAHGSITRVRLMAGLRMMPPDHVDTYRWVVSGRVQGVGFRPFVYRLAHRHGLRGWVRNQFGQVEILAQGPSRRLAHFAEDLVSGAPPLAAPQIVLAKSTTAERLKGFSILESEETRERRIHVPPDYFTCDACLSELRNPCDRRYRYPFVNCTQCGPRYTLIIRLPYDRSNTSMRDFALCPQCRAEYTDTMDRRFHAEPIACPACGPRLSFEVPGRSGVTRPDAAYQACLEALRAGDVVAVKGVGGYHLMCDAADDAAVKRLRERKSRPHKPLGVMFPMTGPDGLDAVSAAVDLSAQEADLLLSPGRPIVLATRKNTCTLSPAIAPGLREVGLMLPYSPLHHLLLSDYGAPLVATSANVSGEPVLTDGTDVIARLGHLTDCVLHHDRPIVRPADDPVFRAVGNAMRPVRLGRGNAPAECVLPFRLSRPVLAVGGHLKNTVALGWEGRAVVSPHIGDMGTPRSMVVFQRIIEDVQSLYAVKAETIACDAHPRYGTTQWAERCGLPVEKVFHHHAHASALAGEHGWDGPWLVFTWDGVGYGEDETLWGGEALVGEPGGWHRAARMRPFFLPGGEKAGREPWRSAAAVCWESGHDWMGFTRGEGTLHEAWKRRINAPQTTAVGRLFDAAAALTGLVLEASFEGQGPMYLEAACGTGQEGPYLPLERLATGLWQTDWAPLIPYLLDKRRSVAERATGFHGSLVRAALEQALRIRAEHGVRTVGLCGGVFQNRVLTERLGSLLEEHGFEVKLALQMPVNDGGISFGQLIELGARKSPASNPGRERGRSEGGRKV